MSRVLLFAATTGGLVAFAVWAVHAVSWVPFNVGLIFASGVILGSAWERIVPQDEPR